MMTRRQALKTTALATAAIACAGTALLLHFDEGSGSTTADSSDQHAVGVLGAPATGDPKEPAWTAGRFGPAVSTDDVDDQVRVSSSSALKIAGSLTVEMWVSRRLPAVDNDVIVNKGSDDASPRNYRVSIESDGRASTLMI